MRGDGNKIGEYGYLYLIDTEAKDIICTKVPIKWGPKEDYKGHSFGVRGLCKVGGHLFVADSSNIVHIFDTISFKVIDSFSVNGVVDIHQIVEHSGLVYIASCGNDSIVVLDKDIVVDEVSLVGYTHILEAAGIKIDVPLGRGALHFNSICFDGETELNLYSSVGTVFDRTHEQVLFHSAALISPHDLLPFNGGLFINNSNMCETLFVLEGKLEIVFKSSTTEMYTGYNKPGYTRGLCRDNNSLFIGTSPVILSEIDISTYEHLNSFLVSCDPNEIIYDMCIV